MSWEEVPDHPSDVILYSLRGAMSPEEMATQPTYAGAVALSMHCGAYRPKASPWTRR